MSDISPGSLSLERQLSDRSRASEKWQRLINKKWWLLAVLALIFAIVLVLLIAGINKAVESNKTKSGAKFGSGVKTVLESIKKDLEDAESKGDFVKMELLRERFHVLQSVFGNSNLQTIAGSNAPLTFIQDKLNNAFSKVETSSLINVPEALQDEPYEFQTNPKRDFVFPTKKTNKLQGRVGKGVSDFE